MRIRFVVFEQDIETRFVLFDEIRLKHKSLYFIINNDKFKIRDKSDQLASFGVEIAA